MLQFGLRLGGDPRAIVTTTPKPSGLLRSLLAREIPTAPSGHLPRARGRRGGTCRERGRSGGTWWVRGSTFDNAAHLAAPFLATVRERYEGTALGRQELYAEVLSEAPGALWRRAWFDAAGFRRVPGAHVRRVVGVDPSTHGTGARDACGIVAAGVDAGGAATRRTCWRMRR